MDIKESVFETIISKTECITQTVGELFNMQQSQLSRMQADIQAKQDNLANELLSLASEMNKNKLNSYATRIEAYVVEHLLKAPYDAKHAFKIHKAMFAERHEMAMFLYENLAKVKQQVHQRIKNAVATPSEKIKVFTYWDNDNNLPPIVSTCRKSLEKHIPKDKFELIILNSENYKDWVSFRKSEIQADISQAHFTDILRMKLLEKWGGLLA
ncbi:capsular polysaccharide synthesis protein [Avibacterium sp. 21-586]|uniref:capsular polysaccharide synthesis protein n=1 Tax=Avibacterium sp. 21-586 TaxID=2911534 RepID=UPI0022464A18|nr:capsular polysaccharide synthesis protein [Avibacterium sp. 21-586]MCW9710257.1 capsular polysaccharide synthesis protein [Avibacterium sp. 21-586]